MHPRLMRLARWLDRPGLRWLAGPLAGWLLTRRYRVPTHLERREELWVCRRPGEVSVADDVDFGRPTWWDHVVDEIFFAHYRPAPGDVILDLGAGFGQELTRFSRAVGAGGRVLAFEPDPTSFAGMQITIEANGLENVEVAQQAVTVDTGTVTLSGSGEPARRTTVAPHGPVLEVDATTIDRIVATYDLDRIDFAKLNIEGAELDALRGAGESLHRIEHLCISCHDFQADEGRAGDGVRTRESVRALLEDAGYTVTRRVDDRPWAADYLYAERTPRPDAQ